MIVFEPGKTYQGDKLTLGGWEPISVRIINRKNKNTVLCDDGSSRKTYIDVNGVEHLSLSNLFVNALQKI